MAGNDISEYETQVTCKKPVDMLGGNMSVKDNLSNFDFMSQNGFAPRQKTSQGLRKNKKLQLQSQYQSEVL